MLILILCIVSLFIIYLLQRFIMKNELLQSSVDRLESGICDLYLEVLRTKHITNKILELLAHEDSAIAGVHITFGGKREKEMILKVTQSLPNISIEFDDKFGNDVSMPENAVINFSLTDPSLASLSSEGAKCSLVPSGALGVCKIQASIVAGEKQFMAEADLEFVPGDIDHISLKLGEAV